MSATLLRPAGPQAEALAGAMSTALAVCAFAFVVAMGALAAALWWRGRRPVPSALWLWGGGLMLPILVFGGLLLHGERQTRGLLDPAPPGALRIAVTGHLWWWSLRYDAEGDTPAFVTANELRVPVGRPVALTLASDDVIHSYWVPALGGKMDLVPGRLNRLTFTAARPGVYRGPCSEYCGTQHATMVLQVVAMTPEDFARWRREQAADPPAPVSPRAMRGAALFAEHGCVSCHTVRGSSAAIGSAPALGPDLTHVASRLWLGAGALRQRGAGSDGAELSAGSPVGEPAGDARPALRAWIRDVQQVKPGARMPSYRHLSAEDIEALAEYLAEAPAERAPAKRPLVAATP